MSFGFGVGDFFVVGGLCWEIYKKCKDSSANYTQLSGEVRALYTALKETEEVIQQEDLTLQQQNKLCTCRQGCEAVLQDLDKLLIKYESLGTRSKRTADRVGFGMEDINAIRIRLLSNVTTLDYFNNISSHAKLQAKLDQLISEIRAGKREGSVVSTKTFDTAAQIDHETWREFRRELKDVGISPTVIAEKKQYITKWLQEAVAAGKLEEDAPSKDESSVDHDLGHVPDESNDTETLPRKMLSAGTVRDTSDVIQSKGTNPRLRCGIGQSAAKSYARPQTGGNTPRSRVSNLIHRLLERNQKFHKAIIFGDVLMIKRLLVKGVDVDVWSNGGRTALQEAVLAGNKQIVELLLDNGADIEARDLYGVTAIRVAALTGDFLMLQLLLERGANVNDQDWNGKTALMGAVQSGNSRCTEILLEGGADVSTLVLGMTLLLQAARTGHRRIMELLLEYGAYNDAEQHNWGNLLVEVVWWNCKVECVEVLLEHGADVDSKHESGLTALEAAVLRDNLQIVILLSGKGTNIEIKNMALIRAARHRRTESVQLLLELGADVDSKDDSGLTALDEAALNHSNTEVFRLLLKSNAAIRTKNKALLHAARYGKTEIVQLLLENGAKVGMKDKKGETAMTIAERRNCHETVRLLRNAPYEEPKGLGKIRRKPVGGIDRIMI